MVAVILISAAFRFSTSHTTVEYTYEEVHPFSQEKYSKLRKWCLDKLLCEYTISAGAYRSPRKPCGYGSPVGTLSDFLFIFHFFIFVFNFLLFTSPFCFSVEIFVFIFYFSVFAFNVLIFTSLWCHSIFLFFYFSLFISKSFLFLPLYFVLLFLQLMGSCFRRNPLP